MKHYDYFKDNDLFLLFHISAATRRFLSSTLGIECARGKRYQYVITGLTKRRLDEHLFGIE